MQILLTGSTVFEGESTPSQSNGGYISGTEVNNNSLSNLFGMVSRYTEQLNRPEYKVIAIYNDEGSTLTGLKAYFNYTGDDSDSTTLDEVEVELQISASAPLVDDCSNLYSQTIKPGASPYSLIFVTADGVDNALSLPNLASEGYYIIFLKRTLDPIALTDSNLQEITEGTLTLSTEENIDLVFVWD